MPLALLAGLLGCGLAPTASVGGLTVDELTLDGARAELAVVLDNPWPVGATADARWSLAVNGRPVAAGEGRALTVAARDVSVLELPISWRWQDLWAAAGAVGEAVPYRAELEIRGESPIGEWSVPLVREGTLPALAIPSLELVDWRLDEVSPTRVAGSLLVGISGAIPLTDLAWSARVGGEEVAHGGLSSASGRIELPVALELARLPPAVANAWTLGMSLDLRGSLSTPLGALPLRYDLAWAPRG